MPHVQRLDYAPAAEGRWARRVMVRAVGALLVAGVLAGGIAWGPAAWQQGGYRLRQQQCMNHAIPVGTIVYSNIEADKAALLVDGWARVPLVASSAVPTSPTGSGAYLFDPMAPVVRHVVTTSPTGSVGFVFEPLASVGEGTTASYASTGYGYLRQGLGGSAPTRTGGFLHRRRSANGGERLVAVLFMELQGLEASTRNLEVNALTWQPAAWDLGSRLELRGLTNLIFPRSDRHRLRFFAGQPDPTDASKFTLSYEMDDQRGTVEGQLDDYDQVHLRVKDGPGVSEASTGVRP